MLLLGEKPEVIDTFYDQALGLQYWQANKNQLGLQVCEDLKNIAELLKSLIEIYHGKSFINTYSK